MSEKVGIVICSRTDSKRCPNKPFLKADGKYLITHLLDRLIATGINIYLAVPEDEYRLYERRLADYINWKTVFLFAGSKDDPLDRTYQVAKHYDLAHVVRVTHDKIFINYKQMDYFLAQYTERRLDYVYSTNFIPGMGFEIFSIDVLRKARETFKDVEHLSYAVESVATNVRNIQHFPYNRTWLNRFKPNSGLRLLIDYPEDVANVRKVMDTVGRYCDITDIVRSVENRPQENSLPEVTVYTCSYQDVEFLDRCVRSVLGQSFYSFEYLLIDDGSTDPRVMKAMERHQKDKRVRVIRNNVNMGLASSSNVANDYARGRYVIRLDSDDYFIDEKVLDRMVKHMETNNTDILYPHNYRDGSIQLGWEKHHVGGTMFKKRMLDFIRFTDGLRHFEGLDLYRRAVQKVARIDYFCEPTFYYRKRAESLSAEKSPARRAVEKNLALGYVGEQLLLRSSNG